MSVITIVAATAEHAESISPFIPAGIAFAVFLALGVVTWSYRDVANRHAAKGSDHEPHNAGH